MLPGEYLQKVIGTSLIWRLVDGRTVSIAGRTLVIGASEISFLLVVFIAILIVICAWQILVGIYDTSAHRVLRDSMIGLGAVTFHYVWMPYLQIWHDYGNDGRGYSHRIVQIFPAQIAAALAAVGHPLLAAAFLSSP